MSTVSKNVQERLRNAVIEVCLELSKNPVYKSHWSIYDEEDLWSELAGCILSSRVPFEQSSAATQYLHSAGILRLALGNSNLGVFEYRVVDVLSRPIFPGTTDERKQRYRFPISRARHMRATAESIYENGNSIKRILAKSGEASLARKAIIQVAKGVGPKQGSLFLRNIGYTKDLAVLDSHILWYMSLNRLLPTSASRIYDLREYELVEKSFRQHARDLGFSVADCDIAVWVTARVARREFGL